MRPFQLPLRIACFCAAWLSLPPVWGQVFKCTGPNGRVEYTSAPCDQGKGQAMSIQGGAPKAAAPAATQVARPVGAGDAGQVSPDRRVYYMEAVQCERARYEVEGMKAELAEFAADRVNGLVTRREQTLKELLGGTELFLALQCARPARWMTHEDGIQPQNCQGQFAEFKRQILAAVRSGEPAKSRAKETQDRIMQMNCAAPR